MVLVLVSKVLVLTYRGLTTAMVDGFRKINQDSSFFYGYAYVGLLKPII